MTFEEFFAKKKIDLTQLLTARPGLYEEFREHYTQMGEKSFDHTKKYWFNRLRKDYRLKEADIPVPRPAVVAAAAPKQQAPTAPTEGGPPIGEPSKQVATVPSGFKPRFKPGVTGTAKPENAGSETPAPEPQPESPPTATAPTTAPEATPEASTPPAATKPLGFKPRFKPGVTGTAKPENTGSETTAPEPQPESPPTATAPTAPEATPEVSTPPAAAKPLGFKPRFKPGVTGTAKPENAGSETPAPEPQPESPPTAKAPEATPETSTPPAAAKPLGFKPRFKPGVTGTAKPENTGSETPAPEPQPESPPTATAPEATPEASTPPAAAKPLGFKPRFKPGVTGTAKPENTGSETPAPEPQPESPPTATAPTMAPEATPEASTPPAATKPLGFKPRFKPGVTGTKKDSPEE